MAAFDPGLSGYLTTNRDFCAPVVAAAVAALGIGRATSPTSSRAATVAYLEGTVWPELRASAREHGADVGLTVADLVDLAALTTPGDPRYSPDQPGHHIVQPAVLVTGHRPLTSEHS